MSVRDKRLWAIAPKFDSVYGVCIPWTIGYTRKQAWQLYEKWSGHKANKRTHRAIRVTVTPERTP